MRESGGGVLVVCGEWDFEEAQVSLGRDALDQSGRALPKIYKSRERKS
jgi:hypothetical protein